MHILDAECVKRKLEWESKLYSLTFLYESFSTDNDKTPEFGNRVDTSICVSSVNFYLWLCVKC